MSLLPFMTLAMGMMMSPMENPNRVCSDRFKVASSQVFDLKELMKIATGRIDSSCKSFVVYFSTSGQDFEAQLRPPSDAIQRYRIVKEINGSNASRALLYFLNGKTYLRVHNSGSHLSSEQGDISAVQMGRSLELRVLRNLGESTFVTAEHLTAIVFNSGSTLKMPTLCADISRHLGVKVFSVIQYIGPIGPVELLPQEVLIWQSLRDLNTPDVEQRFEVNQEYCPAN